MEFKIKRESIRGVYHGQFLKVGNDYYTDYYTLDYQGDGFYDLYDKDNQYKVNFTYEELLEKLDKIVSPWYILDKRLEK